MCKLTIKCTKLLPGRYEISQITHIRTMNDELWGVAGRYSRPPRPETPVYFLCRNMTFYRLIDHFPSQGPPPNFTYTLTWFWTTGSTYKSRCRLSKWRFIQHYPGVNWNSWRDIGHDSLDTPGHAQWSFPEIGERWQQCTFGLLAVQFLKHCNKSIEIVSRKGHLTNFYNGFDRSNSEAPVSIRLNVRHLR